MKVKPVLIPTVSTEVRICKNCKTQNHPKQGFTRGCCLYCNANID